MTDHKELIERLWASDEANALTNQAARALEAAQDQMQEAVAVEVHPDDLAVDRFAEAMKAKLKAAREKGRSGWDDPAACPEQYLATLLVAHLGKRNPGTFEDVANFCMMLHQREVDPGVLADEFSGVYAEATAAAFGAAADACANNVWTAEGDDDYDRGLHRGACDQASSDASEIHKLTPAAARDWLAAHDEQVRKEERERCAKIADDKVHGWNAAAAIRAGGEQ